MTSARILACALLLGLACLTGCGDDEPPSVFRSCGLVVDATSFSVNTDVPKKIREAVPAFLADCDRVAYTVVSGSVGSSDCRQAPLGLNAGPRDGAQGNPHRIEQINLTRRAAAVTVMNRLLDCARQETRTRTGSDVIGALADIARQANPLDTPARLLLISDMAQNTKELNLYKAEIGTAALREAIIARLRRDNRLPRLEGTQVRIVGFGVNVTSDALRQQQFRDFWNLLFQRAGAPPVTYV
ncbi:hypothetical protein [Sphaerisporangium corydalis]|uniref:VWA domain-containing protein n=1 Tax=Sphaerisporangium corydalis TaxID=1441875 RepID=A0ABV9EIX1_9ACTN|nr:hypothetical protein [Sphaerisporangium corydalis]